MLLDCFCQSSSLATVLSAITAPGLSIFMTLCGAAIVTNMYGAVGFQFFREDFGQFCNQSIMSCTVNILYQGTRSGITGLSGMMRLAVPGSAAYGLRVAYDMSYFIVFGIVILNTLIGLIVDSFGAKRHDEEERQYNLATTTFISGIDRKVIETVTAMKGISNGFDYHETMKQPKWAYMAFIFHLQEKSPQDYTGPEMEISKMLRKQEVKWLPIGRSMMLEEDQEHLSGDDLMEKVMQQMTRLSKTVKDSFLNYETVEKNIKKMDVGFRQRLDYTVETLKYLQTELTMNRGDLRVDAD